MTQDNSPPVSVTLPTGTFGVPPWLPEWRGAPFDNLRSYWQSALDEAAAYARSPDARASIARIEALEAELEIAAEAEAASTEAHQAVRAAREALSRVRAAISAAASHPPQAG